MNVARPSGHYEIVGHGRAPFAESDLEEDDDNQMAILGKKLFVELE